MRILSDETRRYLGTALAIVALVPAAAFADDGPVGKWNISVVAEGQENEATLTIVEEDGKYGGTVVSGELGEIALSEMSYKDGELSFSLEIEEMGVTAGFTATIDGDTLEGKFVLAEMGIEAVTTGTRAGETPAIVGTWKLMVESGLGNNPRDLVVNEDLTGTYGGGDFSEFAISNVNIDGDTVQFDVTLSVQGQDLPSHVTLTLDGNKVEGKLDFGQGEASIVGEKEGSAIVEASDMAKFEFCSEAWVALARDYLVTAVEDADFGNASFSFCETFTDAPANLAESGSTSTGWYVTVAEGELSVGKGILPDADIRITADYATVLPLARMVFEGNPEGAAEAAKLGAAAAAAGKMSTEGDMAAIAKVPALAAAFAKLHDTLARRTL